MYKMEYIQVEIVGIGRILDEKVLISVKMAFFHSIGIYKLFQIIALLN